MNPIIIVLGLAIVLFSAILHEVAHGFIADRFGDPTARLLGRLTLNPRSHIDPIMSILLPLMLFISTSGAFFFAAAKPVPVDPFNLRDGRKDMALVALAGPLTNFIIAIIAAILIKGLFLISTAGILELLLLLFLKLVVQINLILGIFNLFPIPPLDGSKIFSLILPEKEANAYLSFSTFGFIIIIILFAFPIGGFSLQALIGKLLIYAEGLLGV